VNGEQLREVWDAAVLDCIEGHPTCSYGGMSPLKGFWLTDPDCTRNHGERCAWCDDAAVTGFAGWTEGYEFIYGVSSCEPCARRWLDVEPHWHRRQT
jgi:hypothetical protein